MRSQKYKKVFTLMNDSIHGHIHTFLNTHDIYPLSHS